jgi:polyvinyl alcohol dehydrogenase (cytochrome)
MGNAIRGLTAGDGNSQMRRHRLAMPILLTSAVLLALGTAALGASGGARAAVAAPRAVVPVTVATSSWTVYHHWSTGTGVGPAARAVNTSRRAWTSPRLDGQLYGEPLVFGKYVYVATENNTVYALVARTGKVAWSRHLGTPVPASALPCSGITPTVGITGTPVIDIKRDEIFVVADLFAGHKPAHHLFGLGTASGKVELNVDVDAPGSYPPAQLQHTALTLDAGQVVFGMGGNNGDCSSYRGRVVAVPEKGGGKPKFFTVDAAKGDSQGAIWMGGAAPVVDGKGHIWVATGNGSVQSSGRAYDDSDGLLELSSSLKLLQYFAPATWRQNNANDLDMSAAPALLSDGQVILAGKSRIVYLLNASHLGGIGGQQASLGGPNLLGSACGGDIDGGITVVGTTVYLPCVDSGVIAVQATKSPPKLRLLWRGAGGGPPIMVAGRIWTIAGTSLYGLDSRTGKVEQRASVPQSDNDFPTPSVGDGLMLCPGATTVVAFAVSAPK